MPDITNYTMVSRTYRYFEGDPLFPFGYGLYVEQLWHVLLSKTIIMCTTICRSYTTFNYSNFKINPTTIKAGQNVTVSATVTNTGNRTSDEVH